MVAYARKESRPATIKGKTREDNERVLPHREELEKVWKGFGVAPGGLFGKPLGSGSLLEPECVVE
jgi:hypothetical protein